jgi:hypothetical protein
MVAHSVLLGIFHSIANHTPFVIGPDLARSFRNSRIFDELAVGLQAGW